MGLAAALALALGAGTGVAASPPHGALHRARGPGACLGAACSPLRGFGRAAASDTASNGVALLLGPAGHTLYAFGGATPAIAVLARDPRTGALRQLPGRRGCVVARPRAGCAVVRALAGGLTAVLSPDGRTLAVSLSPEQPRRLLFAVTPGGALRALGVARGCVAAFDGPCAALRGIRARDSIAAVGPRTLLVFGEDASSAPGLAVLTRPDARAPWHQAPGAAGCANATGRGGCARLRCLDYDPSLSAVSPDRRVVYVAGGDPDPDSTGEGYVATLRIAPDGTLAPIGCVATGQDSQAGFAPVWMATAPRTGAVLLLSVRGSRGDGRAWGQMFTATPGPGGALEAPRPISPHLSLGPFGASASLAPDGRTFYGADTSGGGDLYAFRVTATALSPLPGSWARPYRAPQNRVHTLVYGATDAVLAPGGHVLYLAVGSDDPTQDTRGPQIDVYRTGP